MANRSPLHATDPDPYGQVDLGPVVFDEWHDYKLVVNLSTDPAIGRVDVHRDSVQIATLTGQQTIKTDTIPTEAYLDVVDFGGVFGAVHFDNVKIETGTTQPPPTSAAAYRKHQADLIVAEANNGGAMVKAVLNGVRTVVFAPEIEAPVRKSFLHR